MSSAVPRTQPAPPDPAAPLATPLRVLFVAADPLDVELAVRALHAAGIACAWDRVETSDAFLARLADAPGYDVVISDYRLPSFAGLDALRLLREQHVDLPFILVSAALGEEAAIEALELGAADCVRTDRLERLAWVVRRALRDAEQRHAEREEREVAGALARIGQELISSVDLPLLLDRLCRVTTDVLPCEVAFTMLYREEEDAYVPAASVGDTPERWEAMRALRVPRTMVPALNESNEPGDVLHATADAAGRATRELIAACDVREILAVGLRRGDQLVGVHVAAQRTPGKTFGSRQYRIARGLAQLASLALENARLFDKLEGANQLKSVFLATMSHELRTPLSVIIGYTELLLDEVFGHLAPEQTASLDRVGTSARELLELIGATLDISRLETGRAALTLQEIHPAALLREVEAETAAARDKPGVASLWHVPDDLPTVYSDAVKLKVLLKNLINNAFKFTDSGNVTVRAAAHDHWLELCVADTGMGMSPALQAVIFEPFRQGDGSTTRRQGGVGLGLYIVSRLLDMLAGRIEVESTPDTGSTFRVWIPRDALRPAPLATTPPPPKR